MIKRPPRDTARTTRPREIAPRESRTKRISLNVTPTQLRIANEGAREAGLSTSTFLLTMPMSLRELFAGRKRVRGSD